MQVMAVDIKKQRIQLTMKIGGSEKSEKAKKDKQKNDRPKNDRPKNDRPKKDTANQKRNNAKKPFKKGNNFFDGIVIK